MKNLFLFLVIASFVFLYSVAGNDSIGHGLPTFIKYIFQNQLNLSSLIESFRDL